MSLILEVGAALPGALIRVARAELRRIRRIAAFVLGAVLAVAAGDRQPRSGEIDSQTPGSTS